VGEADLGTVLRVARVQRGMTLRDVESATGIDNAHLSQLETGRIRKPDFALLWELATAYALDFEELARLAGHTAGRDSGTLTVALRALTDLTEEERRETLAYMAELKRRRGADG
jgi:transcriptional regulator with XRE-family HTH domain